MPGENHNLHDPPAILFGTKSDSTFETSCVVPELMTQKIPICLTHTVTEFAGHSKAEHPQEWRNAGRRKKAELHEEAPPCWNAVVGPG
jgi:hypothetical protein